VSFGIPIAIGTRPQTRNFPRTVLKNIKTIDIMNCENFFKRILFLAFIVLIQSCSKSLKKPNCQIKEQIQETPWGTQTKIEYKYGDEFIKTREVSINDTLDMIDEYIYNDSNKIAYIIRYKKESNQNDTIAFLNYKDERLVRYTCLSEYKDTIQDARFEYKEGKLTKIYERSLYLRTTYNIENDSLDNPNIISFKTARNNGEVLNRKEEIIYNEKPNLLFGIPKAPLDYKSYFSKNNIDRVVKYFNGRKSDSIVNIYTYKDSISSYETHSGVYRIKTFYFCSN
jgi:hypothetical protein